MSNARSEPRKIVMTRVQLRWEDATGAARVSTALVEDLSKNGVGIRVSQPIVAGTRIEVVGRGEAYLGDVKHCKPDGSSYFIGVYRVPAS